MEGVEVWNAQARAAPPGWKIVVIRTRVLFSV
jgi:hypothetical protein